VRSRTLARHSCSGRTEHRHQQTREEVATTSSGAVRPFLSGCHSDAMKGKHTARLLVLETLRFAQNGHPLPIVRLLGFARHTCSSLREQRHQMSRPEPALTEYGVSVPLRSGCHSATSSG
jgi:hypothetical protein